MGAFLSAFRLVFALFRRGFGAVSIQRAHAFLCPFVAWALRLRYAAPGCPAGSEARAS
jgi:hypothetical protein